MRNWKMWAMMLVAIFAFSACGTDDEAGELTKLPEVFTGKRVTKIEYKRTAQYGEIEEMTYVNNKLVKYTYVEISEYDGRYEWVYDVTYSGNQVKTYCKYGDSQDVEETLYTLNAEGYAISAKVTDIEDEEEGLFTYVTNQTFEYANGYLTKIVSTDPDGEVTTVQINYLDGDVTSYSKTIDSYRSAYTYTASASLNKGGILPPDNAWVDCDGNLEIGYYAGILGKPTKHLVAKVQQETGSASDYDYTFEKEYVKTMTARFGIVNYTFQ